ncbi:hypothetical protein ACQP2X_04880 [Actinoplanes sp. CA-131856]
MDEPFGALIGLFCLVFGLLFAVLLVVAVGRRRRERDRRRAWADGNGWSYTEHPGVDWGRHLPGANRRGIEYVFSAVLHGRRVSVAHYAVTDADGSSHQHVVVVATLNRHLPPAEVTRRGRIAKLLSGGETGTGHPIFDSEFRVRTSTPPGWLTGALIDAHLHARIPVPWLIDGAELIHQHPGRLELGDVPRHAAAMARLADLVDGTVPQ